MPNTSLANDNVTDQLTSVSGAADQLQLSASVSEGNNSPIPAPHFDHLQFARQFVEERLSTADIDHPPLQSPLAPPAEAPIAEPAESGAEPQLELEVESHSAEPQAEQSLVDAPAVSELAPVELVSVEPASAESSTVELASIEPTPVESATILPIETASPDDTWVDMGIVPDEVPVSTELPVSPTTVQDSLPEPLVMTTVVPETLELAEPVVTPAVTAPPVVRSAPSRRSKAIVSDDPAAEFKPQIHIAGFNSALSRTPQVQTASVPLFGKNLTTTKWTPFWGKVVTFGLTFPEGFEFLPTKAPKEPAAGGDGESAGLGPTKEELLALLTPGAIADAVVVSAEPPAPEKKTRLKPPHDAVSMEDRLFYLLQPPLETWLKGQELIMPFEPFPYQYEGIAWLFAQQAALLADEMGLGKTMQTITAMRLLLRAGQVNRILLVCPKPLIPNWQREFKSWAEELPIVTIEGDAAHRKMQWTMPGVPILLANYEILTRDFEMLADDPPRFDLLILDEAQRIKNRTSRTALTARAIPRKRSWALTGTPIENRPEEMASLYEFMEVIPQAANPDLRQLQKLSKSYVLRRTKDLVMKDLPPRFDREEYLELAPAQKAAYETAEKDGIIQLNDLGDSISVQHVFELVLRLKQITNFEPVTGESAKLDRLEADMEEIAASGGKAILFSQWTKTIDFLEAKLARFDPLIYHGRIPVKKREPVLKEFKDNPNKSLLMMSYATGAVGLNLQFAGYVFLFDRWWNPAVEDQAINRAHRIGQKTQVIVTKFISKDTIEERIDRVLAEKRALFAAVLGDGDNTNVSLSLNASEIFGLFDLKARHGKGTRSIAPPQPPAIV
jgi:superfamily II DNA or RNA helicase